MVAFALRLQCPSSSPLLASPSRVGRGSLLHLGRQKAQVLDEKIEERIVQLVLVAVSHFQTDCVALFRMGTVSELDWHSSEDSENVRHGRDSYYAAVH